ncbi:MAG: hypothetical protein WCA98_07755 [Candidatus Acidiferrales bacterium]
MGDDDAVGRVDPVAVGGDAGIGADGADDAVAGNDGAIGVLDELFEGIAEIAAAAGVEAGGVGVAIKGRTGGW